MFDSIARNMCPKWEKCNAPICPLDPEWEKRSMLGEDPTCFYLSESVKPNAEAVFQERGLGELFKVITESAPAIISLWSRIRHNLERAKTTGSRMTKEPPKMKEPG